MPYICFHHHCLQTALLDRLQWFLKINTRYMWCLGDKEEFHTMMSLMICCTRNSLVIIWLLSCPCCMSRRSSWATTGSSSRQIRLTCRLCSISLSSRGRSANAEMHDLHSMSLGGKDNQNWNDWGHTLQGFSCELAAWLYKETCFCGSNHTGCIH